MYLFIKLIFGLSSRSRNFHHEVTIGKNVDTLSRFIDTLLDYVDWSQTNHL